MARIVDRFQPSFSLFPINNNRTGYQPVNVPLILVIPYRRVNGAPVTDSGITNLRFFIEDAPGPSPVAGFQNRGIFVPDRERFAISISSEQLASVQIDVSAQDFTDGAGNAIDYADATEGDRFSYTLLSGPAGYREVSPGPRDSIEYLPDADYYDLTPFFIETANLKPLGKYNLVWQGRYHKRIISPNDEFVCLNTDEQVLARFAYMVNHPGDIHQGMIEHTPALYFEGNSIDLDDTVNFYRPFADALQDIFDEQEFIRGINWIDRIPAQLIPYLGYLLGIDLPYFPSATDDIRRAVLRNGRRLQQLKGSRRAIRELFEIFGFTIDVVNLWYSLDGTRFIAPNEQLPSDIEDQEITTQQLCQAEPLVSSYNTPGFGQLSAPLLFKPDQTITVDAWLVTANSDADLALQDAVDATAADVDAFSSEFCQTDIDGFKTLGSLETAIPTNGVISRSRVLVDPDLGGTNSVQTGNPVLNEIGVSFDADQNAVNLTFDRYLPFDNNEVLYVFATYERTKICLPTALEDLRSNRFDINVLLFKDGEQPSSDIYEFLLDFLTKFKAFHSLLRKIQYRIEISEAYNVIDFCMGGQVAQSRGTDLGELQTVPPIIPSDDTIEDDCAEAIIERNYKDADIALRNQIKSLLEEEHQAWKDLDNTHDIPDSLLPILQSASRIPFSSPSGSTCQYNPLGQDRVVQTGQDLDHTEDDRDPVCDLNNNFLDYCYKGRVQQSVTLDRTLPLDESYRCTPCALMIGKGLYYLTPLVNNSEFSGGDPGPNAANLTQLENYARSRHDKNYVRLMAFPNAELHYTDRNYLPDPLEALLNRKFATYRPSLEIQKDNLFMPGHRFISMADLVEDFTHPTWNLRPWDPIFEFCPEDLPSQGTGSKVTVPTLNARLEEDSTGNMVLVYDEVPLVYYGNGKNADLPEAGDHASSLIPDNWVTHSIWSSGSPGLGWPRKNDPTDIRYAIDHLTKGGLRFPIEALGIDKDFICLTDEIPIIFESGNDECLCPDADNVLIAQDIEDITEVTAGSDATTVTSITALDTEGLDYIGGYPAEYGEFTVDITDFNFMRKGMAGYGFSLYGEGLYGDEGGEIINREISDLLGLPSTGTATDLILSFKVGSGVRALEGIEARHYTPHRLDCGCERVECDILEQEDDVIVQALDGGFGVEGFGVLDFGVPPIIEVVVSEPVVVVGSGTTPDPIEINRCNLGFFQLDDGSFDLNCDRVEIRRTMALDEQIGGFECLLDGTIPNLFNYTNIKLVEDVTGTEISTIPGSGNFKFIDEYGIIHSGMFETFQNRIDITYQTRDPRVWGEEPSGEVINFRVFRDGVITTCRQIIETAETGYFILAEGCEQEIQRFQTTFGCGDEEIGSDPFAHHLDAAVSAGLAIVVTPVGSGTNAPITYTEGP